ncbi:uncharacterized protein LAESUDRAFT_714838 [Laetiporus sulphureus 93-53]|uniref:Uncharacterized protein n=1 Tax=Laetiporus sulphureus 93-53 TaxID=1314785 RepID=A0A165DTK2_9APHY|nr:uncharacterized protein LAESUDRAFT_714838 [Laetiporus sulphureus 93-53]KZT05606.1 hypothetical protein LAESUDRAFT_714838 [Laetiporus sulphureus 93-53]
MPGSQYEDTIELGGRQYSDGKSAEDGFDDRSETPSDPDRLPIGHSRESLSLVERPRQSNKKYSRRSTLRELERYLQQEHAEIEQSRRALRTALERIDNETHRAQEAENRAYELARRFKEANDARLAAQQEANRLQTELTLYKAQLETVQRERATFQDTVRDLEAQRDDAEAAAARSRTKARKFREQQLIMLAREEGRKIGFREGMGSAYDEARSTGYLTRPNQLQDEDEDPRNNQSRAEPLEELSRVVNLPSFPRGGVPITPSSVTATADEPQSGLANQQPLGGAYPNAAQGSRFRENITITNPSNSTLNSIPPARFQGPSSWPAPPQAGSSRLTPSVVRTASPSPGHPDFSVPPDNWIPTMGADGRMMLPPPHEMKLPPPSPHTPLSPLPELPAEISASAAERPPQTIARDYAYLGKGRSSPRSLAESMTSTALSQFDLLSSPNNRGAGRGDRGSTLSAIPEGSMEFSPLTESRARSTVMPDPITFPVPSPAPGGDTTRRSASRAGRSDRDSTRSASRQRQPNRTVHDDVHDVMPRIAETVRYSNPSVQEWLENSASPEQISRTPSRMSQQSHYQPSVTGPTPASRSGSPFRRPYSAASRESYGQYPPHSVNAFPDAGSGRLEHARLSSGSVAISVQPPSGPESTASPSAAVESGHLTPSATMHSLRPSPSTQPHIQLVAPSPNVDRSPLLGVLRSANELPAGFVPSGPPSPSVLPPAMPVPPQYPPAQGVTSPNPTMAPIPPSASASYVDVYDRAPSRPASRNSGRGTYAEGARPPSVASAHRSRPPSAHSSFFAPPPGQPVHVPGSPAAPVRFPASPGQSSAAAHVSMPATASPRSSLSRLSPAARESRLGLHAGATPGPVTREVREARERGRSRELHRVPSTGSVGSTFSRQSGYGKYDPKEYVDAAFLASTDNLSLGGEEVGRRGGERGVLMVPPPRSPSGASYRSLA